MPRNINRFSSRYTSSMHLKRISHRLETVRYTKRLFSFRNIVHVLTLSRSIQPLCVFFLSFIFSTLPLSLSLSPLFFTISTWDLRVSINKTSWSKVKRSVIFPPSNQCRIKREIRRLSDRISLSSLFIIFTFLINIAKGIIHDRVKVSTDRIPMISLIFFFLLIVSKVGKLSGRPKSVFLLEIRLLQRYIFTQISNLVYQTL